MTRNVNPRPQYFDSSGNPLANGKMFYFVSGTSDPKTTFADINLTIANTNPVILDADGRLPNVFFDGSVRQQLTASDDTQIWDIDPVGGEDITANFAEWNPLVNYSLGRIVQGSDNKNYLSLQNNNIGKDPTLVANEAFWENIEFLGIFNTTISYSINNTVKGSNGLLFRSLENNNQGNDPVTGASEWGPVVETVTTFTVTVIFAKGADVASAAALPLISDGNYFDVTGTTTITSLDTLGVAAQINLHFDGILTLTHNATSLILPGGVNITTAAGDEAEFIEESVGNWRCVNYSKADGTPVISAAGGSMIFLSEIVASAASTVDIETTFDDTFDNYVIEATEMEGGGALFCRMKVGGSYKTGVSDYAFLNTETLSSVSTTTVTNDATASSIQCTGANFLNTPRHSFTFKISNVAETTFFKFIQWVGGVNLNNQVRGYRGEGGYIGDNGAITGIRFFANASTITGTFRLYGIAKS